MKLLYKMLLVIALVFSSALVLTPYTSAQTPTSSARTPVESYSNAVIETQFELTQKCRRDLGVPVYQTSRAWETAIGLRYRRWIYHLWRFRFGSCQRQTIKAMDDVRYAIRLIFRGPGDPRYPYDAKEQAIRVAWCESRWTTTDVTGQYVGVGQLGTSERADYGLGAYASSDTSTAARAGVILQVRSFYRMFVAAGRSWNRWACRPGSGGETSSYVVY